MIPGPVQGTLPMEAERQGAMADTSLEAWARILPTVKQCEMDVLMQLYDYIDATGYGDATGAELAKWLKRDKTSIRPRLTGLKTRKLLERGAKRASRAGELTVRGYRPTLPRPAIERARQKLSTASLRQRSSGDPE